MKKEISSDAIANIRIAMQHLFDCWDALRAVEIEYDIEIETSDLSAQFGILNSADNIEDSDIIEFMESQLK